MADEAMTVGGEIVPITAIRAMANVPALWCAGRLPDQTRCGVPVKPWALHSELVAPHFHGSHRPGCSRSSERTDDAPGDRGHTFYQGPRQAVWRLRITAPTPSIGPNGRSRPDESAPGSQTHRAAVSTDRSVTPGIDVHSMSVFLDAAISGTLPDHVEIPPAGTVPVGEVIIPARAAVSRRYAGREAVFWGRVTAVRVTRHDGLMLALDNAADGFEILLTDKQHPRLRLTDHADLIGRHVMAFGKYLHRGTSRGPYLKVPTMSVIAFSPSIRVRQERRRW